jgi:hypothetical protein
MVLSIRESGGRLTNCSVLGVLSAMFRSVLSAMLGVSGAVTFVRATRRNRLADCERELARHHVRIARHRPPIHGVLAFRQTGRRNAEVLLTLRRQLAELFLLFASPSDCERS